MTMKIAKPSMIITTMSRPRACSRGEALRLSFLGGTKTKTMGLLLLGACERLPVWKPPGALEGVTQQILDLPVQAAHFVVRPPLDSVQQLAIDAQEEGFAFGHERRCQ